MKTTADGFIWKLISKEEALKIFDNEIFEVYNLYDDDSESLCYTREEIEAHAEVDGEFGIEVGFKR